MSTIPHSIRAYKPLLPISGRKGEPPTPTSGKTTPMSGKRGRILILLKTLKRKRSRGGGLRLR